MPQLHSFHNTIHNQRGTETGSQPEEKHLPAFIAAQGLHGRIIDDLDRAPESGFEIKTDPPLPEVVRLCYGSTPQNWPRIADRYHVKLPVFNQPLNSGDHLFGRHGWPGRKLQTLRLPGGENLDMRPAYVNNQHVQMGRLRHFSSAENLEGVILGGRSTPVFIWPPPV